jgi:hypothetical protein
MTTHNAANKSNRRKGARKTMLDMLFPYCSKSEARLRNYVQIENRTKRSRERALVELQSNLHAMPRPANSHARNTPFRRWARWPAFEY